MLGKTVSPRLERLEKEFSESGGEWKEYRIGDLFNIISGVQPDINNRFSTKEENMVNTITGTTSNNGICFYSYSDISFINELTIAKDGEYAGMVFLQTKPFILGGHVLGIFSKKEMTNEAKLYIAGLINKLHPKWKGPDRPSVQKSQLENTYLSLPTKDNIPAFSFMERYIEELEAERIEELEAYLEATGLKNYALNADDVKSLNEFEQISSILPPPPKRK